MRTGTGRRVSRPAGHPFLTLILAALAPVYALVAADRPQDALAEQIARNWSPADQAYSDAFVTIAEKRFADGEAAFDRALELGRTAGWTAQKLAGLYDGRAVVRLHVGRFADARADIDRALADDNEPQSRVGALFTLVEVARGAGDFHTATATLRDLEKLAPSVRGDTPDTKITLLLAEAGNRRAWGDLAGAVEIYEQAGAMLDSKSVATLPRLAAIERDTARCYLGLHQPAKAAAIAPESLYHELHLKGTTRRRPRDQWVAVGDATLLDALRIAADSAAANGDLASADANYQTAAALAAKLHLPAERKIAELSQARAWLAAKDPRFSQLTPAALVDAFAVAQATAELRLRIELGSLAGELAFNLADYADAARFLEDAVALIEQTRATATVEDRRNYLVMQADNYRRLVSAYTRLQQPWPALVAAESLKARTLLETLQPGSVAPIAGGLDTLRELQRRLPPEVAAISYANADWGRTPPVAIVVTHDAISAVELPTNRMKFALTTLPAADILAAQQRDVDAVRYDLGNEVTLAGLIAYYRECLTCPPAEVKARIPSQIAVARLLDDILLEPLRPALGNRLRLLIAPSGLLAYLPFDTLITRQDSIVVFDHTITLTPSLLTTMTLAARPPAVYTRPLLAFGGAIYNPETYAQDMRNVDEMKLEFKQMLAARNAAFDGKRSPYEGVFGGPANNLAGTKAEVQMLEELVPGSSIVTGRDVSETNIRALAAAGELKTARVLHFAVHGAALPEMPSLSCIVLSYEGHFTRELPADRDGLLQITEIQTLPIRAELVVLSACQTGLGAIFAGEGVVGLTGAFLSAGSNRVLASLWSVNDAGTAYFMQRFYRLHVIENVPGDIAMAVVKREFIEGKAGGFTHPQYWAPFNLYGGADLLTPAP